MRTVSYKVIKENGTEFITDNYKEAKADGNYIDEVILTEVDETTEEQKEKMFAHADKVAKILKERKGF